MIAFYPATTATRLRSSRAEIGKENTEDSKPGSARRLTDDYLDRNTIELPAEDRSNRPRHRLDEMLAEEGVDAGYHPEGAETVQREPQRAEEREYNQRSPAREQSRGYEPRSIEKSSSGGRGGGGGSYGRHDEYDSREGARGERERDHRDERDYRDQNGYAADRHDRDREQQRDERDRYERDDQSRARDSRERQRERDDRDRELDAQYTRRRERDYDDRRDRDTDRDYRENSRAAEQPPPETYSKEAPVGQNRSSYPDEYSPRQGTRSYQSASTEPRMADREPEARTLEFVQGKAKRQQQEAAPPQQGGGDDPAAAAGGRTEEAEAAKEAESEYPMVSPINSSSAGMEAAAAAGGGGGASSIPEEENPIYFDTADAQALLDFVSSPAPELAGKIFCEIKRDKKGLGKGSYPVYYLRLERPNVKDPSKTDKVFLLAGRKRKKSKSSNYLISVDSMDLKRDSDSFVAKLRSNFVGTSFTIFDNGESMKSKPPDGKAYRKELGAVQYETNILGYKGPRKMTVIIPAMDQDHEPMEFRPLRESDQLLERAKHSRMDDLIEMTNKSPTWSEDSMSYVLNFGGRVTMASVKNFQIVHAKDPDYVVLQFGRVAEHHFTMDYQYPMSAIQAFAICLSSLDGKLACE